RPRLRGAPPPPRGGARGGAARAGGQLRVWRGRADRIECAGQAEGSRRGADGRPDAPTGTVVELPRGFRPGPHCHSRGTPVPPDYVPKPFHCDVAHLDGAVRLSPRGDLDMGSVPILEERLRSALNGGGKQLVIDLRGLEF